MVCALANAAAAGVLAWQSPPPHPSLALIYRLCGLLGFIRAFSAPAGHAFLPALVPAAILPNAIVLHLTIVPALDRRRARRGGFVYGGTIRSGSTRPRPRSSSGVPALRAPPGPPVPAPATEPFERPSPPASGYVWNDKRLLGAMSLDLFAVLLGGATALLPMIAKADRSTADPTCWASSERPVGRRRVSWP
jgi:hypothetical protein